MNKSIANIKNKKIRNFYEAMWSDNRFVDQLPLWGTMNDDFRCSENSLSFVFAMDRQIEFLEEHFGITDTDERILFEDSFEMVTEGKGKEKDRIMVVHSSALCGLLFFYRVSPENPLTIDGVGTFTEAVFEVESPVNGLAYCSSMDVVLLGHKQENPDEKAVLFLESKCTEFFTSIAGSMKGISKRYRDNKYSAPFYGKEFLKELDLDMPNEEGTIDLYYTGPEHYFYIQGVKQMIAHYTGIRYDIDLAGEVPQKKARRQKAMELIRDGAEVFLGEILFDGRIGEEGRRCLNAYRKTYKKLAARMNEEIGADAKKAALRNRFTVLGESLCYSDYRNWGYDLNEKVREFYFGE